MDSIFDLLYETPAYQNISLTGLKKKISMYHIDFTRGETDRSKLFVLQKENLSWNEAFIILTQRQLMVDEEWLDFENYDSEDLLRWTGLVRAWYINSIYEQDIILDSDSDNVFFMSRLLNPEDLPQTITQDDSPMTYMTFLEHCPLFTETILKVSKSKFKWLQAEFYIETENHYLLYNWYTTA